MHDKAIGRAALHEKLAYLKALAKETGDDLMATAYWTETLPIEWTKEQKALIEGMKRMGAH